MGPQGDFMHSSYTSEDGYSSDSNQSSISSFSSSTSTTSSSSSSSTSSSSAKQLDWSGLVDQVFKEEIDKLAFGYQSGKF